MPTTADDTLATKSYSFWAKSTETGGNPIFDHGDYNIGAFHFNWSSSRAIIHLGDVYVYFDDHASQDDGNWHHHVVYIEHDDITACKWYIDGVANGTQTGDTVGSAAAYTTGIRLGRGGSNYFDGSLDEFAVFDGELTSAQINDIYNGGVPAALTGAEHWYRMGENDSGTGTSIDDQGSGADDLTLVNTPTFSRSVPAEDATWNNRSILFNGSSHYMNVGASNAILVGTNASVSMWFKSDGGTGAEYLFQNCMAAGSTNLSIVMNHTSAGNITGLHWNGS